MVRSDLMAKAVNPETLHFEGNYTSPRSYGVYRVNDAQVTGRRFRFGNHPVRLYELDREYSSCEVIGLFLQREDAKRLADSLNS